MSMHLTAFQYPSTVIIVDDNPDFLANIALQLDPQLALRRFVSPYDALVAINGTTGGASRNDPSGRFFSPYRQGDNLDSGAHVIALGLDTIHREVQNPDRFRQISVAVVDYAMPEIDGLAFCANIKDRKIGKILLTGQADERVAVKAFNDGLINRFIRKQDPDAFKHLTIAIAELQQEYFSRRERRVSEALSVGTHSFLRDPAFIALVERIQRDRRIVEHYLVSKPIGLLMLDAAGNAWRLLVMDREALRSQSEIARELDAPDELVRQLETGRVVPYFWRSGGEYSPLDHDWMANLYPAEVCGDLRFALVANPPGIQLDRITPYAHYLDELDTLA
jgi:CheY-like chemotaxis protein